MVVVTGFGNETNTTLIKDLLQQKLKDIKKNLEIHFEQNNNEIEVHIS